MKRTTVTLPDELAELVDDEARRRRTSVSALVRRLISEGLTGTTERPREIPWAGVVDDPTAPPARDLERVLAREWPDDLDRDRR
jgi:Arc/MetJ-type ribon-helix-helix transcriptional regulator